MLPAFTWCVPHRTLNGWVRHVMCGGKAAAWVVHTLHDNEECTNAVLC